MMLTVIWHLKNVVPIPSPISGIPEGQQEDDYVNGGLGSCNGSLSGRQMMRSRDGRLLNFSDARLRLAANMYNDILFTKKRKGTVPISRTRQCRSSPRSSR